MRGGCWLDLQKVEPSTLARGELHTPDRGCSENHFVDSSRCSAVAGTLYMPLAVAQSNWDEVEEDWLVKNQLGQNGDVEAFFGLSQRAVV